MPTPALTSRLPAVGTTIFTPVAIVALQVGRLLHCFGALNGRTIYEILFIRYRWNYWRNN